MVTYYSLEVDGTLHTDALDTQVNSSLGENNQSSNFKTRFRNENGRKKSDFSIGDEVIIKVLSITTESTKSDKSNITDTTGTSANGSDGVKNRVITLTNITKTFNEEIFIDGIRLIKDTDYTVNHLNSSSTITFLNNLDNNQRIRILTYNFDINADERKKDEKSGSNLTGSSGDTNRILTLTNTNISRNEIVFISGIILYPTIDYTVSHLSASSTITFLNNIYNDQEIDVVWFEALGLGDTSNITNTTGTTLTGSDGIQNRILTLSNTELSSKESIYIDGVYLYQTADYTISHSKSNTTITFLNNIYNNQNISVYFTTQNFTKIFTGIVEDIRFDGEGTEEKLIISGRDYSARLMDVTVQPEVYNNSTSDVITKDIIDKYVDDITYINVETSIDIIPHITFKHKSVFDSFRQIAELTEQIFFIDPNKDLHFKSKSTNSSGINLNNTNVLKGDFKQTDTEIVNAVWIYGDAYLVGQTDTFTANGTGSVFNLTHKPHQTEVKVGGILKEEAGVFAMTTSPASGTQYLVDYDQKGIIFVSGTSTLGLGNNIPASGASISVNYQRKLPLIKYGENRNSIANYGKHEKVIIDKGINQSDLAKSLVESEINKSSEPIIEGNLTIYGFKNLTIGETVNVNLPNHNINSVNYDILEIKYMLRKKELLTDRIQSIKVSKRIKKFTDTIKQIMLDLKQLQASEMDTGDLITRTEFATGSLVPVVQEWKVITQDINNSFILGHPINGILGDQRGVATEPLLGDRRSNTTIQISGGV